MGRASSLKPDGGCEAIRTAEGEWRGNLSQGAGHMRLGSGTFDRPHGFRSRMGDAKGTNPKELIGTAHAGCFSMALAAQLTQAGFTVERIHTAAKVLATEARVPGIAAPAFEEQARKAKENCPVSLALEGVEINLTARLR